MANNISSDVKGIIKINKTWVRSVEITFGMDKGFTLGIITDSFAVYIKINSLSGYIIISLFTSYTGIDISG